MRIKSYARRVYYNLSESINYSNGKVLLGKVFKIVKFCFPFLTFYLTLFAIGIARYELSLVTLNSHLSFDKKGSKSTIFV